MLKWAHKTAPGFCSRLMLNLPLLNKAFIMVFALKIQNKGHLERIHILLLAGLEGYLLCYGLPRKPSPRLDNLNAKAAPIWSCSCFERRVPSIKENLRWVSALYPSVCFSRFGNLTPTFSRGHYLLMSHVPRLCLIYVTHVLLFLTNLRLIFVFFPSYNDCQWSPVWIRNTQKWLLPKRHRRM